MKYCKSDYIVINCHDKKYNLNYFILIDAAHIFTPSVVLCCAIGNINFVNVEDNLLCETKVGLMLVK